MIAVLDYGIGNLRSAQKALEKVGADAVLTDDPAVVRAAAGVVLPGVGHFGRCMEALRDSGPGGAGPGGDRRRHAVPRHLRRHADALRRLRGGPRREGHGRPAGHGAPAARRRQAAADAVERARPLARRAAVRRASRTRSGCTSSTPTPRRRPTTWSPPATTAARSSPPSCAGTAVGHPVPPREVRRRRPRASWPTSLASAR